MAEGHPVERLTQRLRDAEAALARFGEVLAIERPTDVVRDAAIKRFDFTFEAMWRAAQRYLADREQIEAASPGAVIRKAGSATRTRPKRNCTPRKTGT